MNLQETAGLAATNIIGSKLVRRIGFRWIAIGVAAYYGLRMLNKRGMLPQQAGPLFDKVDGFVDQTVGSFGFGAKPSAGAEASAHH